MCEDDGEADQVRRLLAFLQPAMSILTEADRIKAYKDAWERLDAYAEQEVWKPGLAVNFPWSGGKVCLWRTLRWNVETKFQAALKEHLNGEFTHRPIVDFSFMHYSEMLQSLLDIFLEGLDAYIAIQEHISAVSDDMDAYDEDERYMSEKSMRMSRNKRAQEFLDVILFLHAVPQRAEARWDALDHEWDVTWFREHCRVYQQNEDLMAFLRDCAVVVLTVGHFHVAPEVQSMHECYLQQQKKYDKKEIKENDNCGVLFSDGGGASAVLPRGRDARLAAPAAGEPEHVCAVPAACESTDERGAGVGAVGG
jgi:hypothetical protein